jgi:hypothetical protein
MPIHKIDLQKYVTPSDYLTFPEGLTKIAIVSSGGMAKYHGMKTAKGYIPMGMCSEDDSCEQCKKGNEPKLRWVWIVYWIDKECVRLLEVGKMVGDGICREAIQHGVDFTDHVFEITRVGTSLHTKYTVKFGGKFQPTEQENKLILPAKRFLINKHLK